jgi:hypothetical protein
MDRMVEHPSHRTVCERKDAMSLFDKSLWPEDARLPYLLGSWRWSRVGRLSDAVSLTLQKVLVLYECGSSRRTLSDICWKQRLGDRAQSWLHTVYRGFSFTTISRMSPCQSSTQGHSALKCKHSMSTHRTATVDHFANL